MDHALPLKTFPLSHADLDILSSMTRSLNMPGVLIWGDIPFIAEEFGELLFHGVTAGEFLPVDQAIFTIMATLIDAGEEGEELELGMALFHGTRPNLGIVIDFGRSIGELIADARASDPDLFLAMFSAYAQADACRLVASARPHYAACGYHVEDEAGRDGSVLH